LPAALGTANADAAQVVAAFDAAPVALALLLAQTMRPPRDRQRQQQRDRQHVGDADRNDLHRGDDQRAASIDLAAADELEPAKAMLLEFVKCEPRLEVPQFVR